jgi:hypothetical protein
MYRTHFLFVLALAGFLGAPALTRAADEIDIVGTYTCLGENTDGKVYKGAVEISKDADCFKVAWTIGKESYEGLGIRTGNVLSVSYKSEGAVGVVVYKIEKGKLAGKWSLFGLKGKIYTETLTKE